MDLRGKVGLVYDNRMLLHKNLGDPSHQERPDRIKSIYIALRKAKVVNRCERVTATKAKAADLESVHTVEHIRNVCRLSKKILGDDERAELDRCDIYLNRNSFKSALLAAGSVLDLSLRVARRELRSGAAVVRPPGHHAEANAAMGYCLFNNVAFAAHALVHGNPHLRVEKVLIVDWDIHHGNGIQKIFWKDPKVLYFSVHRKGLYPDGDGDDYDKIGRGDGKGFNINVPWPEGTFGDRDYLTVFDQILMPVAREFKPDFVLVSAGFDAAEGDAETGGCKVTPAGYSQMTKRLMSLADGRLVLALEGGYDLDSLSKSFLACLQVMLGDKPRKITSTRVRNKTVPLMNDVKSKLRKYWPVLGTTEETTQSS